MPNRYSVPTDISGKVDKAGDTITGDLTLSTPADINMASGRTVDGVDVSTLTGLCRMKTGTYVGDGSSDKLINISVNLSAASYYRIQVRRQASTHAQYLTKEMPAGTSYNLDAVGSKTTGIIGVDVHGFRVGSSGDVNTSGATHYYTVWYVP